ncbi:MAG TPA: hypothetical protein VGF77_13090 [Allosphingosinicella sp.]
MKKHIQTVATWLSITCAAALLALVGGCDLHRRPTLSKNEQQLCISRGGHESRGGFGEPICQVHFADAGKVCTGKADCQGQCLSDAPDNSQNVPVGTPVVGHCAAESNTFGCYAPVENGKLAEEYGCVD